MPTRVFQHPPALDLVFTVCAKGFQPGHFRVNIVGFDAYMHAFMIPTDVLNCIVNLARQSSVPFLRVELV